MGRAAPKGEALEEESWGDEGLEAVGETVVEGAAEEGAVDPVRGRRLIGLRAAGIGEALLEEEAKE